MKTTRLDLASLEVATFEPTPSVPTGAALASVETNDEICWCMTWVPEDCFGPTAGCSTGTQAQ